MRAALAALLLALAGAAAADAPKVLRYAFPSQETGFDPARISDLYSRGVTTHIFDALYQYDYLARPFLVRPNAAAALPEVSDDFKTWTIRLRPGIYFADDPAFKGQRRELVAQDFVYTIKRHFDPALNSPNYAGFAEEGMLGLSELHDEAVRNKSKFDYDREVEGLRALDRYTIRIKLAKPRPRLVYTLAQNDLIGAVAREVVERYGDATPEHPVGTGPFRLVQWRRNSLIVLERNPGYREQRYGDLVQPNPDDAEGQALLKRFRDRRLPMIDRVEISIVDESQPRWLSFLSERFDVIAVPLEFAQMAAPNGRLAPNLARRGIALQRIVNPDRTLYYFNMEDPLIGGYTPEKVALRRAIALGTDVGREISQVRRGQAIPAQSVVSPASFGYDPDYKSEASDYDPARAKALLDMFGYVDRDGDGWRDRPDGSPLVLELASQPDAISRQFDELWQKNMEALGLRLKIDKGIWPEQLKKARAGQLMIWALGYSASDPDMQNALQTLYGPAAGGQNLARFRNARFDELYQRMQSLPDGPERLALLREAQRIVAAYAPHRYAVHRVVTDLTQPWLTGYRRPLFGQRYWHYVDIDGTRQGGAH
ncbi:MAG: bicyclomycin resistance protein [Piscinibacter sp.]|nr:bicyclomycin resistance protein [Piscinibacter sp.]